MWAWRLIQTSKVSCIVVYGIWHFNIKIPFEEKQRLICCAWRNLELRYLVDEDDAHRIENHYVEMSEVYDSTIKAFVKVVQKATIESVMVACTHKLEY